MAFGDHHQDIPGRQSILFSAEGGQEDEIMENASGNGQIEDGPNLYGR